MATPKINIDNLKSWPKCLIIVIPVLLFATAVVLSFFRSCNDLGRLSKEDVYDPSECGAGFVAKADEVLALLLQEVNPNSYGVSLDSLNARYKALEFALPYKEEGCAYIEAIDLRLVGIHPEYIKDKSLINFYYNSRLPQLLEQQAQHPGETFFSIRSRGMKTSEYGPVERDSCRHGRRADGRRPIVIESIKMIPPMFKVALEKNPWTGVIESSESCLFPDSSTIYLTYGNTVLPIHRDSRFANVTDTTFLISAIMNEGVLMWKPNEKQLVSEAIDYYSYYKLAFSPTSDGHTIRIGLQKNISDSSDDFLTMSVAKDTLRMYHNCGLSIVRTNQPEQHLSQVKRGDPPTMVPFEDGMKILVYKEQDGHFTSKLGEFTLYQKNPSVQLSRLIQSSTGTSRYFISDYQTDLFTQQMLRGLSRHLTNRENIDTVRLSIDPLLSREFENEITGYLHQVKSEITKTKPASQDKEVYDISVTIMDMATGEVLATPFYTQQFDKKDYPDELKLTTRNTSLLRRSIGSTFKPMLALSAVLSYPQLLNLNTSTTSYYGMPDFNRDSVRFFGHIARPWSKETPGFWNGCSFTDFIGRSDDVYPVALAALAMAGNNIRNGYSPLPLAGDNCNSYFEIGKVWCKIKQGNLKIPAQKNRLKFRKNNDPNILGDPFTGNITYLYNVLGDENKVNAKYEQMTDIDLFRDIVKYSDDPDTLVTRTFGLQEILPDQTQLRMNRFYDGDDFRGLLVPWALGQGDNMWNCVKIAEAWARMVSKRDVKASFVHIPDRQSAPLIANEKIDAGNGIICIDTRADLNTIWNAFLDKFHEAQSYSGPGATLNGMNNAVKSIAPNLMLFSKTGTPNAYIRYEFPMLGGANRYMDVGMYTFALVEKGIFENKIKRNLPAKGVICVLRITRSYECNACRKSEDGICDKCKPFWGIKSKHASDFFVRSPNRLRKLIDMTRTYIYDGNAPTTDMTQVSNNKPTQQQKAKPRVKTSTQKKSVAKKSVTRKPTSKKQTTKKSTTKRTSTKR